MGNICKPQNQTAVESAQEIRLNTREAKVDAVKKNTETSNGTLQMSSTKQFSILRDPLSRYNDEALSSSDSECSQKQPVFTNFVTFQALPSQKQMKPKFEFMQDQFRSEMQQLQSIQSKKNF